jgi:hypothetical protein
MDKNSTAKLFGTVGLIGGLAYSIKNQKGNKEMITYVAIFGIAGYLLGSAITKFYSSTTY